MPVYKYKSFDDARKGLWHINPDEKYFIALREFFNLSEKLFSLKFPPGIYKFKNINEANEHKQSILFRR